jgi:hypothetical protein
MKAQSKMRTSKARFFKNLVVLSSLAILAVGCGNQNTSGKGSNNAPINTGINGFNNGQYGQYSGQQLLSIVGNENPCVAGGQRAYVQIPVNGMNINMGSTHIGVSSLGDIAIFQNNGAPTLDLHICQRAGATGQGQLLANPILETSQLCPVSQVTAANVVLSGQQVQYEIAFRPIHIPQVGIFSSICQ